VRRFPTICDCEAEAIRVVHFIPIVEPERLLVNVTEQVERLDADVGAMQPAFKEAPEILGSVGVYLPIHICLSMIDHLMGEVIGKPIVGLQGIAVQIRSNLNVLADQTVKFRLPAGANNLRADLSAALQNRRNNCLALSTSPGDLLRPLVSVHVAGLAADESLISFDFAAQLAAGVFVL
jgi:hypothetical protein